MESKRYADTSIIIVSQWEHHVALRVKIDEGQGTGPILLLLTVAANQFVLYTTDSSKDENLEPEELVL